jgi:hypothetical protein
MAFIDPKVSLTGLPRVRCGDAIDAEYVALREHDQRGVSISAESELMGRMAGDD